MSETELREVAGPLSVDADLTLAADGAHAEVTSTGRRLFVEIGSLVDAVRLIRRAPDGGRNRIAAWLTATDLTAEVRIRDRTVAAVGAGVHAGPISRHLGTAPAEVRVAGVLAAVGQELAAGVRTVRGVLS